MSYNTNLKGTLGFFINIGTDIKKITNSYLIGIQILIKK